MQATLLKKRLRHRCFPVNFWKSFKNTFFHRTPPVAAFAILSRLYWVEYFCYSNLLLQRMLILEFKSIGAFRRSQKSHIDYRFSTTLPLDIKVSKSIICCLEEVYFCLISSLFCLLNLPYILYLHISLRNTYFFAIKHLISEILIWNRLI